MSAHLLLTTDVAAGTEDAWRPSCSCGWVGPALPEFAADRLAEHHRLKAAVLAFAENKMHRPWLKELAAIFEANS